MRAAANKPPTIARRRLLLSGAAASLLVGCNGASDAGSTQTNADQEKPSGKSGEWSVRADMPFAVQEIYPAAYEQSGAEVIVNAGGLTPAGEFNVTDAVTVYDAAANSWSSGPALPQPRHHIALVAHDGALFGVGGFARDTEGGWRMQQNLWRIDSLADDAWRVVAPMPAALAETAAASLGNLIHVAGGRTPKGDRNLEWNDHTDTGRHLAYDPSSDEWTERAPMPTPRNSGAAAVLDNRLYVISGRTVAGGNNPAVEFYDPQTDSWTPAAPLPAPIRQRAPRGQGGLAAAVWNGKIYAFGGEWFGENAGVYADVWEYDPASDAWSAVAAMARPRHGLGGVALSDGIYAIGGATRAGGDGTSAMLDRFVI